MSGTCVASSKTLLALDMMISNLNSMSGFTCGHNDDSVINVVNGSQSYDCCICIHNTGVVVI
jgi:hypothetical protein